MIARCKNCNHIEIFAPNDEFGVRLRLKDQVCECGGKFEKMYATLDDDRFTNSKGVSYTLVKYIKRSEEFKIVKR